MNVERLRARYIWGTIPGAHCEHTRCRARSDRRRWRAIYINMRRQGYGVQSSALEATTAIADQEPRKFARWRWALQALRPYLRPELRF